MANCDAPLTAAERRERRLKRILGDGENRIKKILSGPDGVVNKSTDLLRNGHADTVKVNKRLPPMLEGGEYKFPFMSNGEEAGEKTNDSATSTSTFKPSPPSASYRLLSRIRQMDVPLSLLYGIFVRLVMLRYSTFNIFLPWFLLFFGTRFFSFLQDGAHFVNDIKTTLQSQNLTAVEGLMKRSRKFSVAVYWAQKHSEPIT
ncbi:hypothetical protein COOONC_08347 [Cooperia oncophora]